MSYFFNSCEVIEFLSEVKEFWYDKAQNYLYNYDEYNRNHIIKSEFKEYCDLILEFEAYMHMLNYYCTEVANNDFIFIIAEKLQSKYEKVRKIFLESQSK